jgi:HTH-type transcriptional regulator/antitoxin HigA
MNTQHITELGQKLQSKMPFMNGIHSQEQHVSALSLMDELVESYDENLLLIDVLWPKIEAYEDSAPELLDFNNRIKGINPGSSMLRLLMDQHKLKTTDFQNEIGGKSTVSMIYNEKRQLTAEHIKKLSERFGISPALFF